MLLGKVNYQLLWKSNIIVFQQEYLQLIIQCCQSEGY